ncbi:MAG TPA: glucokinase [Marinilabiliales bacterium]|jgi:glucokinase|nr:MAG: glucokinase [Bacteroidetes bacterium GWA2_40_14]OFX57301.1 MAG: glucokinase [Bacteroidetes bacterium GWC2_40_13]OFX71168.1 MAG: glucokinase [Bacteroidetes bacterium GWD2_40_43]OFX92349.1 MAG: glucokinase [Bacteroidetes bacterium GWE2_40_63]OFY22952.1 MAG: glucokinase [Bacteroidetes bacterium GWF2_40_13]OFZ29958.1 MAG: glucokinase [Bacteroidetes bacterium RIFOXYC2_FULL_40_12]HAM99158.1 glucokinase [Marinilabiliales bacterium]
MKKFAAGVDIGGTNTVIGIVDRDGNVVYEHSIPTQTHEKIEDFVAELCGEIKNGIQTLEGDFELVGIGIGAPNANFYTGTIESAANLRWKGKIEFSKLVKNHFSVPVYLTNDANAAAIGEMIYGGAKKMKNFIVITLGTGLGSGIVVNGKLLYGQDGFAGEMGHVIVEPNGRVCGCGRHGCLEAYVSATGLVRTVSELMAYYNQPSGLREIPFNKLTSKGIAMAAASGDFIAVEAIKKTGKRLGESLADIVAITSPEAIFLFGGLANAGKILTDEVQHHMDKNMLYIFKSKTQLKLSQMNNNAAIMGASALVWNEIE